MRIHQLLIVILIGIVSNLAMSQGIVAEEIEKSEMPEETERKKKEEIENTRITGIPVTTGVFISKLVDYKYENRQNKIQNGARSEFSLSYGNVFHYPLVRLMTFHNVSTYFTLGVALGLRGPDITEDLQAGLTGNLLFNSKSFSLVPSFGYIVAPVHRLNCYSIGDDYPNDDAGLTAPVYRHGWFVSFTFSTKIQNLLKDILPEAATSGNTDNN